AGFTRGDTGVEKLSKLQTLLAATTTSDEDTALLAELLSIPTEGLLAMLLLNLSPHQRKERTFTALVRQGEVLARAQPVLMLVEDAHWADPSSRELFDLVIERLASAAGHDLPPGVPATLGRPRRGQHLDPEPV